jgi:anhydro-N-acetylmuramic acid kinase
MVVDALMQKLYSKPLDEDGKIAHGGMIALELFEWMKNHPYLKMRPPKSTGREMFGEAFVNEILKRGKRYDRADVIAAVSAFTACAVYDSYKRFIEKRTKVDELIVSGGGAKNSFFMDELRRYFGANKIRLIDEFGISASAKEAICFAILANETMAGHPTNIPGVTGAQRKVVLGKICRP